MERVFGIIIVCSTISPAALMVSLRTQVYHGYITVTWPELEIKNATYLLEYGRLNSGLNNVIELVQEQTNVNITTVHQGTLYKITLKESVDDGVARAVGLGFQRAMCGKMYDDLKIGSVLNIHSPNYPDDIMPGVVCTWKISGPDDSWFIILLHSTNGRQHCLDNLRFNHRNGCSQIKFAEYTNVLDIIHRTHQKSSAYNITLEVVPALHPPHNISAESWDRGIYVSWQLSPPEVYNLTVVLKYCINPSNISCNEIDIDLNTTSHVIDTSENRGKIFIITMFLHAVYGSSNHSEVLRIRSACKNDISLVPSNTALVNTQDYETDVICIWRIRVYSKVHWISITTYSSSSCVSSQLQTFSRTVKCSLFGETSWIEQSNYVEIEYSTGINVQSGYMNFTINTVDMPTDPPLDLKVKTTLNSIHALWLPPFRRPEVIKFYTITYIIHPYNKKHTVTTTDLEMKILTSGNEGQMYMLEVSATTDGGTSNTSSPVYVRSSCGESRLLLPKQSKIIIYPGHNNKYYLPNIQCRWIFTTQPTLWFKISVDTLNIENSKGCRKDYLRIENTTQLCGRIYNEDIIRKNNVVKIDFMSDDATEDTGFILSITAVGTPPEKPRNLSVIPSTFGLLVKWLPPLYRKEHITSYTLFYKNDDIDPPVQVKLLDNKFQYLVDTTKYPGTQYEIWMVSNGEVGTSIATSHLLTYSKCGENIVLSNSPSYIISPYFGRWQPRNAFCRWHVSTNSTQQVNKEIRFKYIQLPTSNNQCEHFTFDITGVGKICQLTDSHRNYTITKASFDIVVKVSNNSDVITFLLAVQIKSSYNSSLNVKKSTQASGSVCRTVSLPSSAVVAITLLSVIFNSGIFNFRIT